MCFVLALCRFIFCIFDRTGASICVQQFSKRNNLRGIFVSRLSTLVRKPIHEIGILKIIFQKLKCFLCASQTRIHIIICTSICLQTTCNESNTQLKENPDFIQQLIKCGNESPGFILTRFILHVQYVGGCPYISSVYRLH